MKDFRELRVWQKAHSLTLHVYNVTKKFPKEEMYGLTSQIRRASSSIAANIAEGCGRKTDADSCRFLVVALGSGTELEYHLLLSHDLKLLTDVEYESLQQELTEIKKMLNAFITRLST
ncbi:MAG: four helix bundle protein [Ignavibacteriales bacterium]|nr:four helix bundle protein [Ignavibacteriales bacterium]